MLFKISITNCTKVWVLNRLTFSCCSSKDGRNMIQIPNLVISLPAQLHQQRIFMSWSQDWDFNVTATDPTDRPGTIEHSHVSQPHCPRLTEPSVRSDQWEQLSSNGHWAPVSIGPATHCQSANGSQDRAHPSIRGSQWLSMLTSSFLMLQVVSPLTFIV